MAYSEPFRLRTLKALTAIIESVDEDSNSTVGVGLQGRVFRGRSVFGAETEAPLVAILETIQPLDQTRPPETAGAGSGEWDLFIQGIVEDDAENPLDPAYLLSAKIIAKLAEERRRPGLEDSRLGRSTPLLGMTAPNGSAAILDILIGAPVHRPPDDISGSAYFWFQITLKTVEDLTQPFA